MIFTWLRNRRRKKILSSPMPGHWEAILDQNVRQLSRLNSQQRALLFQRVQIFVREKYWEGCNGFQITEEVKLTIAGQACLITLGFARDCFDHLKTILVYPDTYAATDNFQNSIGVLTEGTSFRLGESWGKGPIVLSWSSIYEGGQIPDDGRNVVVHEFAHYYDASEGQFNGTPPLHNNEEYQRWEEVMTAEFQELRDQLAQGEETFIDPYGSTNPAEFFAVCSEHFFEQGSQMREYSLDLYETLKLFYQQDPAQAVV
ncbi:MAG: zinc-dependent peptidase [Planctomycetes bacterium]|nr:zinc-dependent peptidase [Planctomycetota bacterium]MCH9726135.1 zinc-dependent peptidase [Planctomycetota bacterium]MCH9775641.1 zinc-dependent peptidase [Planctomycetota bacterium]MCH9790254.1 zinc-dependent peptidase [Planctomycetota bacterium]